MCTLCGSMQCVEKENKQKMQLTRTVTTLLFLHEVVPAFTRDKDKIKFIADNLRYGPRLEVVHAYYNQWPTGKQTKHPRCMFIRVSSDLTTIVNPRHRRVQHRTQILQLPGRSGPFQRQRRLQQGLHRRRTDLAHGGDCVPQSGDE